MKRRLGFKRYSFQTEKYQFTIKLARKYKIIYSPHVSYIKINTVYRHFIAYIMCTSVSWAAEACV